MGGSHVNELKGIPGRGKDFEINLLPRNVNCVGGEIL